MMTLSELTEATTDTTSEEIAEFAEQVVKEVEADRKGDSKSDAQITSEQADTPQPEKPKTPKQTAEEKSSSKSAPIESEESGDDTESSEWLSDDVKAEAAAYGIDESELTDFASREEFEKALRLLDKTAREAGRKAMAEGEESKARNEKGQFVKKEEPKADIEEELKKEPQRNGRYEISQDFVEEFDDKLVGEITRMRDHYESRLEALELHFAEAREIAEEQRFDSFVDSLGHDDLFGVTGKESAKELERREALFEEVRTRKLGLERLGRSAEISETLVRLAARTVFADELEKKLLKQKTSKISRQSNGRLGGSPTKPIPPSDDPREEADRLYKELSKS